MKIPLKWCIAILLRLSQAAATLTTVQLVFDAKLTLVSTAPLQNPATPLDADRDQGDFPLPISTSLILAQYNSILPIMPL